jgi:hypothetical protein
VLDDFLGREAFRQRIKDHRDIDPRTLDTRFAATNVGFHHYPLQEFSVCVISHFQTILLDPKVKIIDEGSRKMRLTLIAYPTLRRVIAGNPEPTGRGNQGIVD